MISAVRICPKCGWGIPADAPEGGCPGCLLESGIRLLDEDAVAGAAEARSDEPERTGSRSKRLAELLGELGDYELLEEVGRGGQGVVFRARQKSLDRTVALKVISLGQWASEAHLKRFRREAHAAASLDHPSIVPIYEVGERDGSCYFSMKFVEGGQLDEVVKHAPMSIRQAAELIAKVARTVHYAHEHGILHRDIKPGNILLDKAGEPHLTDFGLARLLDVQSSVTRTIDVLGTPSYMAPEQAAGDTTKLSKATDVYGLGAVLYQLLTGQPPFAGGTTYETIRLLRETEPRPPRSLNSKIDRELSTICLKCLEKDPKRRYSSALALAEDLEHWLKHEPIQAKPSGFFTHARKWVRRNPSTAVLVTLLVALAVGLSVTVWNRKPAVVIPKSVAVLPFENFSDDPNNAYFADGIQQEILTRLASIADLKVISRSSTQRYHSKPGNLAEIAKQLGVANIVEGSVQKTADQVRVNVQLINAQTDSHLWADTYDRKLTDIFGVESEIAKQIAESLQAKLTGPEEQALKVKPTNNPDAYDAYLRGLAFEARNYSSSGSGDDVDKKAIGFYERAVELDPNFAIAWARFSRANAHILFSGLDTTRTPAAWRDTAKRALENAQKLDPHSPETLLALGYYQYWVLRDYGAAQTTFKQVSKMLRSGGDVPHALALIARIEGNWDQSIAYYEQALELDPRNVNLLDDAAMTYWMVRQFPVAIKLYDRALDILPNDPQMTSVKAGLYQAQGNLQEAANLLSGINEQTANDGLFGTKIHQLLLERNYSEAIRLIKARPAHSPFHSDFEKAFYHVGLAFTQRFAGDLAGAKVTAQQARNILEPLYKDQPNSPIVARQLAGVYAVMGEKDLAVRAAEKAVTLMPRTKDAWRGPSYEEGLATVLVMVGENKRAISTLRQLLQTPYIAPITPALLRLNPEWDPLRSDPAFQKLCEEKIDKSIAVLPFENLSDPHDQYFSDGLSEELISALAQISELKVIGRSSSFRFKATKEEPRTIGEKLGVSTLLEGTVRKQGDRVRIVAALTNAADGIELWTRTFDRELKDIFAVQEEIAKAVAESLKVRLVGSDDRSAQRAAPKSVEAHNAYLQGHFYFQRRNLEDYRKAITYFDRAIELDNSYALAYAERSETWTIVGDLTGQHSTAYPKARSDAEKAVAIAPALAETHAALGWVRFFVEWKFAEGLSELEHAIELSSGNPTAHGLLARAIVHVGKPDEAEMQARRAVELDPLSAAAHFSLGRVLFHAGKLDEAAAAGRKMAELQPSAAASHRWQVLVAVQRGDGETALREAQLEPDEGLRVFELALAYYVRGERDAADAALGDLIAHFREGFAYQIAQIYAAQGEVDKAFEWLQIAFDNHDGGMPSLSVDPLLRGLRDDARYKVMLEKVGLPVSL